jgi:phosphoribosyl 1,2-cyclic phosphate phosphodiesterase
MELIFLGCSDDQGVPRIGCDCEVCQSAHSPHSRNRRSSPSLVLRYGPPYAKRTVLIDAAPEFRLQAIRQGLGQFDALLLTHTHDAHLLGFGALVRAQRELGLPLRVCAPPQILDAIPERFAHLWTDKTYRRVLQLQPIESSADLWDLEVRALRVDHGIGGVAYGYLLTLGELRLAYISDMLRPTDEIRRALTSLNLLVLGARHYYEGIELWKRSVMDITSALELICDVTPTQAILTHLSHTVEYDGISGRLPPQVHLAYDGLTVEVHE